jgi:lambda repressor-like predicted transcriptional regulator
MTPDEIRIELIRVKTTMAKIARAAKVTRNFVWQVVHGRRRTRRIREAIAQAVGKPIRELWPEEKANGIAK